MSRAVNDRAALRPSHAPAGSATLLRARWQALAPREKALVRGAAALVALALLWWIAIAPALDTLRTAPAAHQRLDAQLQQMRQLQAQEQQLQAQPRTGRDEAQRALQASVQQRLGAAAQLGMAGERATLTLKGVPAQALAPWLAEARANARSVPAEAHVTRTPAGPPPAPNGALPPPGSPGAPAGPDPLGARWSGTVVLDLPTAR